jgi:hypothetical protein
LEHEVNWEAATIALHRLIEHLGWHLIESREAIVEDHAMTANRTDGPINRMEKSGSVWIQATIGQTRLLQP